VSWILLLQLLILMTAAAFLVEAVTVAVIDKRREDAIHRKEAGL
jgi:hypothetical protein